MREPESLPLERIDLLAYLESILGCVKSLHVAVGALIADVAAIRNTVFEDPGELAQYRNQLKRMLSSVQPLVEDTLRSDDDWIKQQLGATDPWKN